MSSKIGPTTRGDAVLELRDAAVHGVFTQYVAAHPQSATRMGPSGVRAFRQDVGFHVEHLAAALDLGDPELFESYVDWVADVFAARGLSLAGFGESLSLLATFLRERLGDGAADAESLLGAARGRLGGQLRARETPPGAPVAVLSSLTQNLVQGDHRSAWTAISAMIATGSSYADVAVDGITPAMVQVGEGWQSCALTVAQEHLATANAALLLGKTFAAAPMAPLNGRRALFAAVEGNRHALGLQMVADTFALAGWETQYLGADVPTRDLLAQVDVFRPELVALSSTLATQVPAVRDAVTRIRASQLAAEPRIVIGGQAFSERPELWRVTGADGWSRDARTALDLVG